MKLTIEGVQYELPLSLSDITLQQRADYDLQYGRDLRTKLAEILEMKQEIDRELAVGEYQCDVACKTLSFFGNIPMDVVVNTDLKQVLAIYDVQMKALSDEYSFTEEEFEISQEITWQGETWVIAHPELKSSSAVTFGEFLDAKQSVKDLFEYSNERWSALISLCCTFLRKKGEAYSEALSDPDGERYKLMQTLPLDYAINVGFFLSGSMSTYISISRFSTTSAEKELLS